MAPINVRSMKYALLVFLLLLITGFILESWGAFSWVAINMHSSRTELPIEERNGQKEVWVEIHDVSPVYGAEPLLEVVEVLDGHSNAYERAVILVIPNHAGNNPLRNHPEFTQILDELEKKGYTIGVHGYKHPDPTRSREFMTEDVKADELIDSALAEFGAAGLNIDTVFAPPGWLASQEAAQVLREKFQYVYYYYYMDTENAILPYPVHEYTWYGFNPGLWKAKLDYKRTKGVFRLSVHINAVNSKENLKFLDDFLSYVEETK